MKKFFEEFKKFITKGNALDMAVGVIIGGAFTAIVSSLNTDIITPLLAVFGGVDFSHLTLKLGNGELAPVLTYGNFITAIINFLIMAFIVFMIMKVMNGFADKLKKKEEPKEEAPTTKKCPYCLSEIPIEATRCAHCTSMLEEK